MGGKLLPNMNFTNTQLNTQYILTFNGKYQIPQKTLSVSLYIYTLQYQNFTQITLCERMSLHV